MSRGSRVLDLPRQVVEPATRRWPPAPSVASPLAAIGRRLREATGRPPDPGRDGRLGLVVLLAAGCTLVAPVLALVVVTTCGARSVSRRRTAARRQQAKIRERLGDVIDLLTVALLNGSTVLGAVEQVSQWIDGELGDAFQRCTEQVANGQPVVDALELLMSDLDAAARPVIAVLLASERYGAPIGSNLSQLAASSRDDRRRQAEAATRRLPVALMFPLVTCVLPAFMLLTVVPVVIDTVQGLAVNP